MENIREFINEENVIKDEIYKAFENSVICQICSDIFIEPTMCMECQNVYCKECIDNWSKRNNKCPNRCQNTHYQKSLAIIELLSKIKFICKKCDGIINYDDMKKHRLINCINKKNIVMIDQKDDSNLDIKEVNSK